jgi:hypothetical protein
MGEKMSKFNKLSKDIPPTETDLTIEVEGEVTKKKFIGEFTCKIPRRKELCLIDKHRAFLNGSMPDLLDPQTLRFHHEISYLRYTVTESPKWWKEADLGYELYDGNVVTALYEKVLAFEVEWLTAVWGEEAVKKLQSRNEDKDGEVQEPTQEKGA